MLTTDEALARILAQTGQLDSEMVSLQTSLGRFLASDHRAALSLPRFDQSSMDGYAVAADECGEESRGRRLEVRGEIAAGREATISVAKGRAVRIFTGAPVPEGTGAVIMQEDVSTHEDQSITINVPPEPGEFIRRSGADMCAGQILASAGQRVTPQLLAVLATQGTASVSVGAVPKIGILSTGDELIPVGDALPTAASIYNSNGPMLQALVTNAGGKCVRVKHGKDDLDSLVGTLRDLSNECDIVIVSGGVSVGDHDHVRPAMEQAGYAMDFWKVRMKPGKPLAFGVHPYRQRLVFGLPGNPVSAFITFWLFVFPALRKLMGAGERGQYLQKVTVAASTEIHNRGDRAHWFRGCVTGARFEPFGLQESHALFSLSKANALMCVPPESSVAAGIAVDAYLLPGQ